MGTAAVTACPSSDDNLTAPALRGIRPDRLDKGADEIASLDRHAERVFPGGEGRRGGRGSSARHPVKVTNAFTALRLRMPGKLPLPLLYALGCFCRLRDLTTRLRGTRRGSRGTSRAPFPTAPTTSATRYWRSPFATLDRRWPSRAGGGRPTASNCASASHRQPGTIHRRIAEKRPVVLLAAHMPTGNGLYWRPARSWDRHFTAVEPLRVPSVDADVRDPRARSWRHPILITGCCTS